MLVDTSHVKMRILSQQLEEDLQFSSTGGLLVRNSLLLGRRSFLSRLPFNSLNEGHHILQNNLL